MPSMDDYTTVSYLRSLVDRFHEERGWHDTPRDLLAIMATEVEELAEHFRFKSDEEVAAMLQVPARRVAVAHDLADVLHYVLAFASALDFDLSAVFRDNLSLAASRHPVPLPRGSSDEPTDLHERAAS